MSSVLPLCTFHLYVATLKQQFAYGIYISQLIGYSSACGSGFRYLDVLDGELLLLRKLLNQVFLLVALTATEYLCHKWPRICSTCRKHFSVISAFIFCHRLCNKNNAAGVISGYVARSLVFCVVISLFVCFYFFF
jgi:hypothetical protein